MKRLIYLCLTAIMLCIFTACNESPSAELPTIEPTQIKATATIEPEMIPAFEKEEREILPLPKKIEINDSVEFVDSIMANYEVINFTDYENSIELNQMQMEESEEGYVFSGLNGTIRYAKLNKPLNEFFDTPENSYGVLIRFKTEKIYDLNFILDSKFGRIMLDFYEDKYPAVDLAGDSYGDPMYNDDWNNYFYELGDWAYLYMTINKYGQKNCYIWSEDNPSDYNFHTSYGEDWGGDNPYTFNFSVAYTNETVVISDIFIYSYEELKR